jgi:hypothetical protein
LIVMVRRDVFEQWGWPEAVTHPEWQRVTLAEILQPAENVRDELWLGPDVPVTWTRDMSLPFSPEELLRPVEVGHILDGGWGCRVYAGMTPATKASSWGPAGRTHLVAQQRRGQWYARRLGAEEVARIFDPDGLMKVSAADPEQQVAEFGNSGPSRMVQPYAEGLVKFLRPPMSFVPEKISEIIDDKTVQVCRGWMVQAETDFREQAKQK